MLWHRLPTTVTAQVCSNSFGLVYSALDGFILHTQRSLIIVLIAQWAWMRRRSVKPAQCLVIALVVVVVLDPLASFDMGFWLSYGAVAILMLAFSGRYATRPHLPGQRLFEAQWAVFIGLLVPLAVLLNSNALLAPVANVLAIPLA